MIRVPSIDPKRDRLIAHYLGKLDYFQRIPARLREAEGADEAEETCRSMLAELRAPGFERPVKAHQGEVVTFDEFLGSLA